MPSMETVGNELDTVTPCWPSCWSCSLSRTAALLRWLQASYCSQEVHQMCIKKSLQYSTGWSLINTNKTPKNSHTSIKNNTRLLVRGGGGGGEPGSAVCTVINKGVFKLKKKITEVQKMVNCPHSCCVADTPKK